MKAAHVAAERQYAKDAKALERPAFQRLSSTSRRLLGEAESQARARDDDHVGTEHLVLAIYAFEQTAARRSLVSVGVTPELFALQLHDEPGPSPPGTIPLTPRSRMIVCLAGVEADRTRSELIEPEHILLGVVRESQRWEATGMAGPHQLRRAAEAAGATLAALEQKLIQEMGCDYDLGLHA
jgi:ATP-dependent Clp protease ATP-binding subunit ClpA